MLVRACDVTYSDDSLQDAGIVVKDANFKGQSVPEPTVIEKWLHEVDQFFDGLDSGKNDVEGSRRICVHCENGKDHSPFLVALVLQHKGMPPKDIIKEMQESVKGSIDFKQAQYILKATIQRRQRTDKGKG